MIQLRPYQTEIINAVRAQFAQGVRNVIVESATGSGKTTLSSFMLKTCAEKGMSAWVVMHRRELVKQWVLALDKVGLKFDIIANGFLETRRNLIKVCSIGALRTRAERMVVPNMIIWDEAHHLAAKSFTKIYGLFPKTYHIGLTATPERLDGKGLKGYFKTIVKGPTVRELIEQGFLSDYRIFAPPGISTEGMHMRAGDFAKEDVNAAADKPTLFGNVLHEYLKHAKGKRVIGFAPSIKISKELVDLFLQNGVPAAHVDGETDMQVRDEALRLFAEGKILYLGNVDLFGEGFDLPCLDGVILYRPTASIGLYRQQVGRALRPSQGKTHAIILDHAGNVSRHGLPEEVIDWKLEGHSRDSKPNEPSLKVKICPSCFAAQAPGRECRYCGKVFPVKERKVARKEGPLSEMDIEKMRAQAQVKREQGKAQSYEDLVSVGIRRGMKYPMRWASHVILARKQKAMMGKEL